MRLHSLRFHDILHTLDTAGHRFRDDGDSYLTDEPEPAKIIDTLRLTQTFREFRQGHYTDLMFSNGEKIAVDADMDGVRIYEVL